MCVCVCVFGALAGTSHSSHASGRPTPLVLCRLRARVEEVQEEERTTPVLDRARAILSGAAGGGGPHHDAPAQGGVPGGGPDQPPEGLLQRALRAGRVELRGINRRLIYAQYRFLGKMAAVAAACLLVSRNCR